MKEKKIVYAIIKYLPFVLFFLFAFYLHSEVGLRDWDDYVYKDSWKSMTIFEWIKKFYMNWSGRIPLQMMHIVFLQFPVIVWRIWDSLLYTLCVVAVARVAVLFGENTYLKQVMTNCIVSGLFVLIPDEVLNRVVKWMAGSFNYLLPVACLFFALYPIAKVLKGNKITKIDALIAFIPTILCCYAEQTAAVYICMSLLSMVYLGIKKISIPKSFVFCFMFGFFNAAIEYLAPGNMVRYDSEVILWYNQYDMYSLFDKIIMGVTFCVKMLLEYGWILFLVAYLFMLPKVLKNSVTMKLIFIALFLYTISIRNVLKDIDANKILIVNDMNNIIIVGMLFFWIMLVAILLLIIYIENLELSLAMVFSFLAAIASGTVVAMSPSCYTSEQRIFFVSYILLIFIIGLQIQGKDKNEQSRTVE